MKIIRRIKRPIFLALGLIALTALSGCAVKPASWQKANTSPEEQRADLAQCRAYAETESERDYMRSQSYSTGSGYGGQSTYQKNMDAYQVKKSLHGILARCMKLRGYSQVRPGG